MKLYKNKIVYYRFFLYNTLFILKCQYLFIFTEPSQKAQYILFLKTKQRYTKCLQFFNTGFYSTHIYEIKRNFLTRYRFSLLKKKFFKIVIFCTLLICFLLSHFKIYVIIFLIFIPEYIYIIIIAKNIYIKSNKLTSYDTIEFAKSTSNLTSLNWLNICEYRAFLKLYIFLYSKKLNFKNIMLAVLHSYIRMTPLLTLKLISEFLKIAEFWNYSLNKTIIHIKDDEYSKIREKRIIFYFGHNIFNMMRRVVPTHIQESFIRKISDDVPQVIKEMILLQDEFICDTKQIQLMKIWIVSKSGKQLKPHFGYYDIITKSLIYQTSNKGFLESEKLVTDVSIPDLEYFGIDPGTVLKKDTNVEKYLVLDKSIDACQFEGIMKDHPEFFYIDPYRIDFIEKKYDINDRLFRKLDIHFDTDKEKRGVLIGEYDRCFKYPYELLEIAESLKDRS